MENYYVNKDIKNTYRIKCNENREIYLRLDMNENPIGLPYEFIENIKNKINSEFIAMYPNKNELISLISARENIEKECISITNGSDEAIRLIFETFGKKDKDLISISPTFEMYDVYCNIFGLKHVSVSYDEDFNISIDDIVEKINKNTSLVSLLNPNSPIGNVFNRDDVKKIIERAKKFGAIVIIDEAYFYFCPDTYIYFTKEYDNVLVLRTFSKLCSMAGLRIGYVCGNKNLIHYIDNAQSTYNVNSIAILFASELLKKPDLIEGLIKEEKEGHEFLAYELERNGYKYYSAYGNYILFRSKIDANKLIDRMKDRGILIRTYKTGILKDWIRVTTGRKCVMQKFLNSLLEIDGGYDEA